MQEVVAAPRDSIDHTISVRGVMLNNDGWELCSLPLRAGAPSTANFGAQACISVSAYKQPFDANREKYEGAVVTLTGPYWNECLPESQAAIPEIAKQDCKIADEANGWIGPAAIHIEDYLALHDPPGDDGEPVIEVTAVEPGGGDDIGVFANALVDAMKKRSVDGIAMLFPDFARGRVRVWLRIPGSEVYWRFFSSEMAPAKSRSLVRGVDYALFQRRAAYQIDELCICRRSDCRQRWPATSRDYETLQNLGTPYVCFSVAREGLVWLLQ